METTTITATTDCAATTAPGICGLIRNVAEQKENERKAKEAAVQARCQEANEAIRRALDAAGLRDEIEPHRTGQAEYSLDRNKDFEALVWKIDGRLLEVADFYIRARPGHYEDRGGTWGLRQSAPGGWTVTFVKPFTDFNYGVLTDDTERVGQFFHERHAELVEQREAKRKEQINVNARMLNLDNYSCRAESPDAAAKALDALLALDPDNAKSYRAGHDRWLVWYQREEQERAEKERAKAERKAREEAERAEAQKVYDAYYATYRAWYLDHLATRRYNTEHIAALQAELDRDTFKVWKLEYGVVATDEEGHNYLERDTAMLSDDDPDHFGYYNVLRDNDLVRVRFANPIQIEDIPDPWIPSEHKGYARRLDLSNGENGQTFHLYTSPLPPPPAELTVESAGLRSETAPPDEPEMPQGYDHWLGQARSRVEQSVKNGESGAPTANEGNGECTDLDDLPF